MFLDVFDKLLKENNLNKRQFALKSGIPYTTVDGFYKKGYENIRLTTLRKIADFFNVSLDYLVFGSETRSTDSKYDNLNIIGKAKADEFIEMLSENPKYTKKPKSDTNATSNSFDNATTVPLANAKVKTNKN